MKQHKRLKKISCNLCGSDGFSSWGKSGGLKIVKCNKCDLVYVNPRLDRQNLKAIYGKNYFDRHTQEKLLKMRLEMYKIEIAEIERLKSKGKILDVGCGEGYMLSLFGNQWQKYGTEINKISTKFARDKFHLNVKVGNLKDAHFPNNYFDVVSIRGVIEHLTDPLAETKEMARILKPTGVVAINTPNIDCLTAKIYKENYRLIDSSVHLYYFSPATLSNMVEKAGLRVIEIRHFYLGTPYASPVKDFSQIVLAVIKRIFGIKITTPSPPFFDNVIHLYASKS